MHTEGEQWGSDENEEVKNEPCFSVAEVDARGREIFKFDELQVLLDISLFLKKPRT